MKKFTLSLLFVMSLSLAKLIAQPTFTMAPSLCTGNSTTVTANIGTLTAMGYSWASIPSAIFSTPSQQSTGITFTAAGVYTVGVGVFTSNGLAYTTTTILINTTPTVSIVPSSSGVCAGYTSTLTGFGATSYTWDGTGITPGFQQSVAVGPGTYSLVGANGGCVDSALYVVYLLPPLNITVTQSSNTTCITSNAPKFSKAVHLIASGAGTYVWYPVNFISPTLGPQVDVRPAATTCYTVVGSTAICSGTAVICVTVVPQFSAGVTPASPTICNTESVNLSVVNIGTLATGPASSYTYAWTEALNAPPLSISSYFTPTVSVYPQNSTTYTMEVWDAAGCVSSPVFIPVQVDACLGISKASLQGSGFSVYPNPVKEKLYVRGTNVGLVNVEITDAIGKIVCKENREFSSDNLTQGFTVTALPAGVYFVRISGMDGNANVIRMIKQ